MDFIKEKVLIVGKASPHGSKKYRETVCTGVITESGLLRRIYPVPYRFLEEERKYNLWDWIEVEWMKNLTDTREETYRLKSEYSLDIVSNIKNNLKEKIANISKVLSTSLEDIEELRVEGKKSLAIVQVEDVDFYAERKKPEEEKVDFQRDMFRPDVKPLQNIPYAFHLKFYCKDSTACRNRADKHDLTCLSWEPYATYVQFKKRYSNPLQKVVDEFRLRRFNEEKRDIYVLLTTHFKYKTWMLGQFFSFEKGTVQKKEQDQQSAQKVKKQQTQLGLFIAI